MFERCLWFNLGKLVRRVNRRWEAAFAEVGLSPSHAYLLRLVLAQPGIGQAEVVRELGLEKSTVTRFVQKLEAQGYVRRERSRGGGRPTLHPTASAQALQARLEALGDVLHETVGERIGLARLTVLVRDLRQIATRL